MAQGIDSGPASARAEPERESSGIVGRSAAIQEVLSLVAHAAPLDRFTIGKGGPYSHGTSRKRAPACGSAASTADHTQISAADCTGVRLLRRNKSV